MRRTSTSEVVGTRSPQSYDQHNASGEKYPRLDPRLIDKGRALLKSVTAEHKDCFGEQGPNHGGKTCRRCLALEEIDTPEGQRAVRAFLEASER